MSGKDIRKALELKETGLSCRQVAERIGVGKTTVERWYKKLDEIAMDFATAKELEDETLRGKVCRDKGPSPAKWHPVDADGICARIAADELTIQEAYWEYQEAARGSGLPALKRSAFHRRIQVRWKQAYVPAKREMAQNWAPGEYMMIDFAGDAIKLMPQCSGEQYTCRLFVCVLAYSRLMYWHVTRDATTESWLEGLAAAFEYFGGVPMYVILDNDVALVTHAERGNKGLNRKFEGFCEFYRIEPSTARVGSPRDKGAVEEAVKIATTRFIRKIQAGSLQSIDDVRALSLRELERCNNAVMAKYGISRWKFFEQEKPRLRALPKDKYAGGVVLTSRKVRTNGCIRVDTHEYGVPPEYFGKSVGFYVGEDALLHIVDLRSNREIAKYPKYQNGEPDGQEAFLHIDPLFRAAGQLSPEERLARAREDFGKLSPSAATYITAFIAKNSRREKGELAETINYMRRKLLVVDRLLVELVLIHAIEMGCLGKDELLGYLESYKAQTGLDGKKRDASGVNEHACLRTAEELLNIVKNKTIH